MKMFGECHAHIFLNGYDYRKAVETQKNGPRDALIRAHLEEYRKRGIRFVRDGGDHYGVSKRAARNMKLTIAHRFLPFIKRVITGRSLEKAFQT